MKGTPSVHTPYSVPPNLATRCRAAARAAPHAAHASLPSLRRSHPSRSRDQAHEMAASALRLRGGTLHAGHRSPFGAGTSRKWGRHSVPLPRPMGGPAVAAGLAGGLGGAASGAPACQKKPLSTCGGRCSGSPKAREATSSGPLAECIVLHRLSLLVFFSGLGYLLRGRWPARPGRKQPSVPSIHPPIHQWLRACATHLRWPLSRAPTLRRFPTTCSHHLRRLPSLVSLPDALARPPALALPLTALSQYPSPSVRPRPTAPRGGGGAWRSRAPVRFHFFSCSLHAREMTRLAETALAGGAKRARCL